MEKCLSRPGMSKSLNPGKKHFWFKTLYTFIFTSFLSASIFFADTYTSKKEGSGVAAGLRFGMNSAIGGSRLPPQAQDRAKQIEGEGFYPVGIHVFHSPGTGSCAGPGRH